MLTREHPLQETRDEVSATKGLLLRCPRCHTNIVELVCPQCAFHMEVHHGIVHTLSPGRAIRYRQFMADYEYIRTAEGRGSRNEDFYLALPYKDTTGKNSHQWKIRAKSYDYLTKHVLSSLPDGALMLDLGAGNCWMSFRLARLGYTPVAADLLTNEHDGLGAASHLLKHLSAPFPRFQAEVAHLPFRDGQFDAIVFNASFHYSEDYEETLLEALRCLKPAGLLIISDTPWYSRDESGKQMVAERQAAFHRRFGTASDSLKSLEYLTDERLRALEGSLSIRWMKYVPWYGWRWALRPWIAKLRHRREPSQFRIYVARKHACP